MSDQQSPYNCYGRMWPWAQWMVRNRLKWLLIAVWIVLTLLGGIGVVALAALREAVEYAHDWCIELRHMLNVRASSNAKVKA